MADLLKDILSLPPEDRAPTLEQKLHEMLGIPLDLRAPPGTLGVGPSPDFSGLGEEIGTSVPQPRPDPRKEPKQDPLDFSGLGEEVKPPMSFTGAVGRGVDVMQGMLYGGAEATGELLDAEGLTEFGREGRTRNLSEAEAYGERSKFSDIGGLGDFGQWVKETVGEQIPIMAPSLAGGIAGAGVGALGGPLGAMIGGALGAFVPNYALGVGETQGNIKDKDPEAVAPGWAFAGGTAIAALDSVLPGKIGGALVKRFGMEAAEEIAKKTLEKPVKDGFIKRTAKGVAEGMATEGVTEALQEAIGEVAAAQGTGQDIDWSGMGEQMLEAGAAGALMGGIAGGGSAAVQTDRAEKPQQQAAPRTARINDPGGALHGEEVLIDPDQSDVDANVATAVILGDGRRIAVGTRALAPAAAQEGHGAVPGALAQPTGEVPAAPVAQPTAPAVDVSRETPDEDGFIDDPEAPLPPPASPAETAILRAAGYSDEDIAAMEPEQRAAEIEDARDAGVNPVAEGTPGTRTKPVKVETAADVEQASVQAAPEPSEGQKDAGNYKKAHIKIHGLDVAIENPKGSTRSGTGPDGKPWSVEMPAAYGYVKRSKGADGDQVDVYIGEEPESDTVFVIDQVDPQSKAFDEHKAVLGVRTIEEAEALYEAAFSDGRGLARIGAVTEMPVSEFADWAKSGDTSKPLAYEVPKDEAQVADVSGAETKTPDNVVDIKAKKPTAPEKTAEDLIGDAFDSAFDAGLDEAAPVRTEEPKKQAAAAATPQKPAVDPARTRKALSDYLKGTGSLDPEAVATALGISPKEAQSALLEAASRNQVEVTKGNRFRRTGTRKAPVGLLEFIASRGGIRDDGGELASMDLTDHFVPGSGRLVRKRGLSPDRVREMAVEAGYIGEADRANPGAEATSTLQDLWDAIAKEAAGQKVISADDRADQAVRDEDASDANADLVAQYGSEEEARLAQLPKALQDWLSDNEIDLKSMDGDVIAEAMPMIEKGMDADSAIERAFVLVVEREDLGDALDPEIEQEDIPGYDEDLSGSVSEDGAEPEPESAGRDEPDEEGEGGEPRPDVEADREGEAPEEVEAGEPVIKADTRTRTEMLRDALSEEGVSAGMIDQLLALDSRVVDIGSDPNYPLTIKDPKADDRVHKDRLPVSMDRYPGSFRQDEDGGWYISAQEGRGKNPALLAAAKALDFDIREDASRIAGWWTRQPDRGGLPRIEDWPVAGTDAAEHEFKPQERLVIISAPSVTIESEGKPADVFTDTLVSKALQGNDDVLVVTPKGIYGRGDTVPAGDHTWPSNKKAKDDVYANFSNKNLLEKALDRLGRNDHKDVLVSLTKDLEDRLSQSVEFNLDDAERFQRTTGAKGPRGQQIDAWTAATESENEPETATDLPDGSRLADFLNEQENATLATILESKAWTDAKDMLGEIDSEIRNIIASKRRSGSDRQANSAIAEGVSAARDILKAAEEGSVEDLVGPSRDDETGEYDYETGHPAMAAAQQWLDLLLAQGFPVDQITGEPRPGARDDAEPMAAGDVFPDPGKVESYANQLQDGPFVSQDEADALKSEWKKIAAQVGKDNDNGDKVIFSLFDYTGKWSKPWADAGFNVVTIDIKTGKDLLTNDWLWDRIEEVRKEGYEVYGVLSACPCTTFSGAGARWWRTTHDKQDPEMLRKVFGDRAMSSGAKSPLEYNLMLVDATREFVRQANPTKFHVLENPIGRIQSVAKMSRPAVRFHPHNFGDPYTKQTNLFGVMDAGLPTANVDPVEGSKIQSKLRGDRAADKEARSTTPEGFSYAFFMANAPQEQVEAARLVVNRGAAKAVETAETDDGWTDLGDGFAVKSETFPQTGRTHQQIRTPEGTVTRILDADGVETSESVSLRGDYIKPGPERDAASDRVLAAVRKKFGRDLDKLPSPEVTTEETDAGTQTVLPGAERISEKEQAEREGDKPLRGKKPQKGADDKGLFGSAKDQGDLVDMAKTPKTATVDAADSDETVEISLTEKGPWDFNDTWPAPDDKQYRLYAKERNAPFGDPDDIDPEAVASTLDEALNELQVHVNEQQVLGAQLREAREAGSKPPKKGMSREKWIKELEGALAQRRRDIRDLLASYDDLFPHAATRAMLAEARKRVRGNDRPGRTKEMEAGAAIRATEPAADDPYADLEIPDFLKAENRPKRPEKPLATEPAEPEMKTVQQEAEDARERFDKFLADRKSIKGLALTLNLSPGAAEILQASAVEDGRLIKTKAGYRYKPKGYDERIEKFKKAAEERRKAKGEASTSGEPAGPRVFINHVGADGLTAGEREAATLVNTKTNGPKFEGALRRTAVDTSAPAAFDGKTAWRIKKVDNQFHAMKMPEKGSGNPPKWLVPPYKTLDQAVARIMSDVGYINEYGHYRGQRVTVRDNSGKTIYTGEVAGKSAAIGGGLLVHEDGADVGVYRNVENPIFVVAIEDEGTSKPDRKAFRASLERGAAAVFEGKRYRVAEAKAGGWVFKVTADGATVTKGGVGPSGRGDWSKDLAIGKALEDAFGPETTAAPASFDDAFEAGLDEALGERTKTEIAKSAAKNAAESADLAMQGLVEMFGGGKKLTSGGLAFDPETYERAKPLFRQAAVKFIEFKNDVSELVRRMVVDMVKTHGLTRDGMEQMRPYLRRFIEDVNSGTISLEGAEETDDAERPDLRPDAPQVPGTGAPGSAGETDAGGTEGAPGLGGQDGGGDLRPSGSPDEDVAETPDGLPPKDGSGQRDPGGRGGNRPSGGRVRPLAGARARLNYQITAEDEIGAGGPKDKVRRNIEAIRTLKAIEEERREATDEEKKTLVRYVGWGAFAQDVFADAKANWAGERQALKDLLTADEYAAARASTLNAHYTSEPVIRGMWRAMEHFGFDGGRALEPSSGIGHFIGLTPDSLRDKTDWAAVELDPITGGIATQLYRGADVNVQGFETFVRPDEFYDLAISNVPFGAYKLTDKRYPPMLIHDYFFVKSLDKVRPGGMIAFITSDGTLDKVNPTARKAMAERAEFVGAIRLPGGKKGAFAGNAGTEVTTDIIFMRKKAPGGARIGDDTWLGTEQVETPDGPATINAWFAAHPEMMLGELRLQGTMYKDNSKVLVGDTENLDEKIAEAAAKLPAGVFLPRSTVAANENAAVEAEPVDADGIKEGAFFIEKGVIYRKVLGVGQDAGLNKTDAVRVKGLMEIRDIVTDLLARQAKGQMEGRADLRKALNKAYDAFVKKHGPINRTTVSISKRLDKHGNPIVTRRFPNFSAFKLDPDAYTVAAIENYDTTTGEAKKTAIFSTDIVGAGVTPQIENASDALAFSLDQIGKVDIAHIAFLRGKSEDEIIEELDDSIYLDPQGDRWRTADDYLSGDVVTALANAEAAVKVDATYLRNVEALREVQPAPLTRADVRAPLGAPWIPERFYEQFLSEEVGTTGNIALTLNAATKRWRVVKGGFSAAATAKYGHDRMKMEDIVEAAFNQSPVQIVNRHPDGSTSVDQAATEEVRARIVALREAFAGDPDAGTTGWVYENDARASELETIYNDRFNRIVPKKYDGSHLSLPGLATTILAADGTAVPFKLRPHQKDAVWRTIQSGNTLLDHVVGAGKAQPLDAKILTPSGWVRMGDIKIGDQVIAGDGTPTRVVGVFPQGKKDIFSVRFSDGSSTECCDEHLWMTQTYRERGYAQRARKAGKSWTCGQGQVRQLSEIRETLTASHLGAKNHSIPMVGAVEFIPSPVPVDPYLLGALIGDGCLRGGGIMFSTGDAEMIDNIKARLPADCDVRFRSGCDYAIVYTGEMAYAAGGGAVATHPVKIGLVNLGVWGKYAHEKRVPSSYLHNSRDIRLDVLRGLMDTDGTVTANGTHTSFCTTSPGLADDVTEIVRSLGGIATRSEKRIVGHRTAAILTITLPPEINPFLLKRKADRVRPKSKYAPVRYIVDVTPVGAKPAQCIAVEHPSHLYVTDDYLVTHNTFTMIAAGMEQKRLGLIQRPMYVVPNHMLEQFSREFLQAYPGASILVADKDSMSAARRKEMAAKIAAEKWDGIIITHDAFGRLRMSDEAYADFIRDEIAQMEEMKRIAAAEEGKGSPTVKDIERAKKALEAKLDKLLNAERKDTGVIFEELGIDMLFIDEAHCFPYDTLVATDRGFLKIGDIVEARLDVNVASLDHETGTMSWRPIHNHWRHDRGDAQFVTVHADGLAVKCTDNHHIYVEGRGYVEAKDIRPGETLLVLPQAVRPDAARSGGTKAEILLEGVLEADGLHADFEDVPDVRGDIHLSQFRGGEQPEAAVLRQPLRLAMAHGPAWTDREVDGTHARRNATQVGDRHRVRGAYGGGSIAAHDFPKPDETAERTRKNAIIAGWADLSGTRRERAANRTSVAVAQPDRTADGSSYRDEAGQGRIQELAEQLQGRLGGPVAQLGDRGRRENAQAEALAVSGRPQDGGAQRARVVRVEVHERGSDGRSDLSGGDDRYVYDLGIEGHHNYFANGVLVHNSFKNLSFQTRHTRIKGIGSGDAQRATDLFIKVQHLEKSRPGRSAVFATGTPLSNTMAELYTMQRYLQLPTLKSYGIEHFDAWAGTFGEIRTKLEIRPDGRTFKDTSSFSRFVNIPELVNIYGEIADSKTAADLNLPTPKRAGGGIKLVEAEMSPVEVAYMATLVKRAEGPFGRPEKGADNMLKIVSEGRKLATDFRLLRPDADFNPKGKTALLVENVARIWKNGKAPALAQMIFLDMGTPKAKKAARPKAAPAKASEIVRHILAVAAKRPAVAQLLRRMQAGESQGEYFADFMEVVGDRGDFPEIPTPRDFQDAAAIFEDGGVSEDDNVFDSSFNLYEDIRTRLVERGIPRNQIAFIHEATDDLKKARLFEQVRSGEVRVIIGSTGKMGVGTNVQRQLVAMHHFDAPWKPAEVEQRDGRIERQGNLNKEIEIYRYITKKSFDTFMWQTLERKAEFITQIRAGAKGVRVADDIDDVLPEASQIKAAASGDPRIQEHAELTKKIRDLENAKRAHERTFYAAQQSLKSATSGLERVSAWLEENEADAGDVTETAGDKFAVVLDVPNKGSAFNERKLAGEAIRDFLIGEGRKLWSKETHEYRVGTMSGFRMVVEMSNGGDGLEFRPTLKNRNKYSGANGILTAETDPIGLVRRFENLLRDVPAIIQHGRDQKAEYEKDIPRLTKQSQVSDFPKAQALVEAKARHKELTEALTPKKPDPNAPQKPEDGEAVTLGAIRSNQTRTPEFKRWFEGSKIIDDNGDPMVVHHFTYNDFETFDSSWAARNFGRDPDGIDTIGNWFTDNADARYVSPEMGGKRMDVYLSVKKPFYLDDIEGVAGGDSWLQLAKMVETEGGAAAVRERLQSEGYDGIILNGTHLDGVRQNAIIAFRPEQIKSATANAGAFDPENPSILASTGGVRLEPAEARATQADIEDAVNIVARVAGKRIKVEFHDTISTDVLTDNAMGGRDRAALRQTSGGFYRFDTAIPGRELIGLALNDPHYDLRTTAGHEAWHHVEFALLTDAERALLKREMPRIARYAGKENYGNQPDFELTAIAFQRWRRLREEGAPGGGLHIGVRRFFERVLQVLRQVKNALLGRGYSSFEQIFERARAGEYAGRAERQGAGRSVLGSTRTVSPAPVFYSQLLREIEGSKQAAATPDQWMGLIRNMKGIKAEELKWVGVEDWLKSRTGITPDQAKAYLRERVAPDPEEHFGFSNEEDYVAAALDLGMARPNKAPSVTREALADFVRSNQIEVREVVKGKPPEVHVRMDDWRQDDPDDTYFTEESEFHIDYAVTEIAYEEDIDPDDVDMDDARVRAIERARQAYYENPDRDSYRTISVEIGDQTVEFTANWDGDDDTVDVWSPEIKGGESIVNQRRMDDATLEHYVRLAAAEHLDVDLDDEGTQYESYALPGGSDYTEFLLTTPWKNNEKNYRGPHWDEPNVLAHVRFDTRTDAWGKKTLFIQEIQSDWHQAGRDRGYIEKLSPEELAQLEARIAQIGQQRTAMIQAGTDMLEINGHRIFADEFVALADEKIKLESRLRGEGIPDAPFKNNAWAELAMKRMMRYAAENGFERIAWTPGEVQAERYDLSNHVQKLGYKQNADGTYFVSAQTHERGGVVLGDGKLTANDLAEHVGKNIAQQIVDGAGDIENWSAPNEPRNEFRVLRGIDLKVGGEGMKAFYDRVLRNIAGKLGKKWGAKVGTTQIKADNAPEATVEHFAQEDPNHPFVKKNRMLVHSMDVTPEMRDSVLAGQPLFQRGKLGADAPKGRSMAQIMEIEDQIDQLAQKLLGHNIAAVDLVHDYLPDDATGEYLEGVIRVAMTGPDPVGTLRHEAIHALRRAGVFSAKEWAVLERRSIERWMDQHDIEGIYGDFYESQGVSPYVADLMKIEEGVAFAFAAWNDGRYNAPPRIRAIFQKIKAFIEAVRNYLEGLGFQTAEDIFGKIEAGEMKDRADRRAPYMATGEPAVAMKRLTARSPVTDVMEDGIRTTLARASDATRVKIQDRALPIRRVQEEIERELGVKLPVSLDTYMKEGLYYGRAGERVVDLQEKFLEPLIEKLRAAGITTEDFGDYLYARHAEERNARILEIDPDNDAGSGMTDEEARDILDRIAVSPEASVYESLAADVDDLTKQTRNTLYRAGLIDKETYEDWRDQYQSYVPLRGFEASPDEDERPRTGSGFGVKGKEAFQALGRRSKADNPLAYAILQAQQAIVRSEKNRVGKTLMKLVEQHPNADVWQIHRGSVKRRINPATGLVEKYFVPPSFSDPSRFFPVKIGGRVKWLDIKHPGLSRAMTMPGIEMWGTALGRGILTVARTYAALATQWNPGFILSNFTRDLETALINVTDLDDKPEGLRRQIVKDAVTGKSIRGILSALMGEGKSEYAPWFEEYRLAGGKVSFIENNDIGRIKRRIETLQRSGKMRQALQKTGKLIEDLNTSVENGVRLSVYIAMRKAGVSKDKAAFTARELTVNFNRRGELGPALNAMWIFFNASIQGGARLARAVAKSPKVRWTVAGIAAAGIGMEFLNAMLSGEDDDGENAYDKIPDWVKERNLIIMIPGSESHEYIQIPLAYGYNAPYLAGQQLAAVIRGKKKALEAGATVAYATWSAFNPIGSAPSFAQFISPTLLDPWVQSDENKNWYGGPIMPDKKFDPRKPDSETYFSSAPFWLVDLAKWLNTTSGGNPGRSGYFDVSPETIEHYLEFLASGTGKFALNAVATGERILSGEELLPEKVPFVRRVYNKATTSSRRRDFYEAWNEVDAARYEVRTLIKDGQRDLARERQTENRAEISAWSAMSKTRKALSSFRKERDRINEDREISSVERRKRLDALTERENAAILRALSIYNRAKKAQEKEPSQ